MQMIFQRAVPARALPGTRPQLRGGSFALEPVEALDRLADRVTALAARSLEPNPFFLPEFLGPAIQTLGRGQVKLAVIFDRDDLRFFAPVVAGRRKLTVWSHPYAPLGTPLIDGGMARQVADAVMRQLRTSGRRLLLVPDLPLDGASAKALRQAARRRGSWTESSTRARPVLHAVAEHETPSFEEMIPPKRRKELDRQLRRLCDKGAVSFMSARTGTELESALSMFMTVEASGWKGRRGTALQRRQATRIFAHDVVVQMAQRGGAAIDVLRFGERPIAALIRFEHGGLAIPWKIAYDEEFAAFSPGKQLMCDETRRWLADPRTDRVDPVCEHDNPMMVGLWPDRERYGTLFMSPSRLGLRMRAAASLLGVSFAARTYVKSLIGGGRSRKRGPKARP